MRRRGTITVNARLAVFVTVSSAFLCGPRSRNRRRTRRKRPLQMRRYEGKTRQAAGRPESVAVDYFFLEFATPADIRLHGAAGFGLARVRNLPAELMTPRATLALGVRGRL